MSEMDTRGGAVGWGAFVPILSFPPAGLWMDGWMNGWMDLRTASCERASAYHGSVWQGEREDYKLLCQFDNCQQRGLPAHDVPPGDCFIKECFNKTSWSGHMISTKFSDLGIES